MMWQGAVLAFFEGNFCEKDSVLFPGINVQFCEKKTTKEAISQKVEVINLEREQIFLDFARSPWLQSMDDEQNTKSYSSQSEVIPQVFEKLPKKPLFAPFAARGFFQITLSPPFQGKLQIIRQTFPFLTHNLEIVVKSGVKATILQNLSANDMIKVRVEEDASLEYVSCAEGEEDFFNYSTLEAEVLSNSHLNICFLIKGPGTNIQHCDILLNGHNAAGNVHGLVYLSKNGKAEVVSKVEHLFPSSSVQHVKSVLQGKSSFDFSGEISTPAQACDVTSLQLNNNLLLSNSAKAMSTPTLKIAAEKVQVNHGATFTKLKEEELFFLRCRGFDKTESEQFLTNAFCQEILNYVKDNFIKGLLEKRLATWKSSR